MSDSSVISEYYDIHSLDEDARLSPLSMEYLMTLRLIELYGRKAKTVCDLGGGTGVYAIPLAKSGKKVLLDISKKEIEIAEQKARLADVQLKAKHCDIFTDTFVNEHMFDLVLCLGPLYHCRNIHDVDMALNRIHSMMHHDGIAIIAFLSKYSKFNDASRKYMLQENDLRSLCNYYDNLLDDVVFSFQERSRLPISYVEPNLIKTFLTKKGLEVCDIVASDVFGCVAPNISNQEISRFLEVSHKLGKTCKFNDGNHILAVIKKS